MICCKIIFDVNNKNGNIGSLLTNISKHGEFLWEDRNLYFADTSNNISEKKIESIVKKSGFNKVYIDVYNKDNQPNESDNINGWLIDKLVIINYKQCQEANQQLFRDTLKGLDLLDAEIDRIKEETTKENKED